MFSDILKIFPWSIDEILCEMKFISKLFDQTAELSILDVSCFKEIKDKKNEIRFHII